MCNKAFSVYPNQAYLFLKFKSHQFSQIKEKEDYQFVKKIFKRFERSGEFKPADLTSIKEELQKVKSRLFNSNKPIPDPFAEEEQLVERPDPQTPNLQPAEEPPLSQPERCEPVQQRLELPQQPQSPGVVGQENEAKEAGKEKNDLPFLSSIETHESFAAPKQGEPIGSQPEKLGSPQAGHSIAITPKTVLSPQREIANEPITPLPPRIQIILEESKLRNSPHTPVKSPSKSPSPFSTGYKQVEIKVKSPFSPFTDWDREESLEELFSPQQKQPVIHEEKIPKEKISHSDRDEFNENKLGSDSAFQHQPEYRLSKNEKEAVSFEEPLLPFQMEEFENILDLPGFKLPELPDPFLHPEEEVKHQDSEEAFKEGDFQGEMFSQHQPGHQSNEKPEEPVTPPLLENDPSDLSPIFTSSSGNSPFSIRSSGDLTIPKTDNLQIVPLKEDKSESSTESSPVELEGEVVLERRNTPDYSHLN